MILQSGGLFSNRLRLQETSLLHAKNSTRNYSSDSELVGSTSNRPRTVHILKKTAPVNRGAEIFQKGVLSEIAIPDFRLVRHVKPEHRHLAYRIIKTAKDHAIRIETKFAAERMRQEMRQEYVGQEDEITWTLLLRKMELRTPPIPFREKTLRIGGSDEAIIHLEEGLKSDTKLRIVPGSRSMSSNRYNVTLIGSVESIEAAEIILANPIRISPAQSTEEVFVVAAKISSDLYYQQNYLQSNSLGSNSQRTDNPHFFLPRYPTIDELSAAHWTITTFAQYVRHITLAELPGSVQLKLRNRDIVLETLIDLFENSVDIAQVASPEACHDAISFLVRHGQTSATREFIASMEQMGCPPTTDTFNILLRGCAKSQNLRAFNYLLEVLHRRGLSPNYGTWIALLQLVRSAEKKQKIMREIHHLGFPKEFTARGPLAVETIPYTVGLFLDDGGSISTYIEEFDKLYGPGWCHNVAVHRLLDALGARGCITDAVNMINDFRSFRDYIPDAVDVTVLLTHCVQHRTADIAIWLVNHAAANWQFKADRVAFVGLFRLAWDSRMYNVSRVIWKYACAQGQLDPSMQQTMSQSLVESIKSTSTTVRGRWNTTASSVICGTVPSVSRATSPIDILDGERRIFGTRYFTKPFCDMLNEAFLLDKKWTSQGVRESKDLAWKVHHAICIPSISMSPKLRRAHLTSNVLTMQGAELAT